MGFWLPFLALMVAPLGGCAGSSWRDAAAITATEAGLWIKKATDRTRPNGEVNDPGFPSQHAARSFAYTAATQQTFIAANRDNAFSNPSWL